MTYLGRLGRDYSDAYDINGAGQVVGDSFNTYGPTYAFITGPNGLGMTGINTPSGINGHASGINNTV